MATEDVTLDPLTEIRQEMANEHEILADLRTIRESTERIGKLLGKLLNGASADAVNWQRRFHSAITDAADTYAISLLSRNGTATATVTIRNMQTFAPTAATWSTDDAQSGTAMVDADGSITVTGLTLSATAIRLTLTPAVSASRRTAFASSGGGRR